MITMSAAMSALAQTVGVVPAQDGSNSFTLEDLNFGGNNYYNMVARNKWCVWWGDQLVRQDAESCWLVDKNTGKEKSLFSLSDINSAIASKADFKVHSLYNTSFPYAGKTLVVIKEGSRIITVDFAKHALISTHEFADNEQVLEFCAKSEAVAYLKDSNLCVTRGMRDWKLTDDGSRQIVYGQSVHRDEFGISKGTFFSPDGTKLAFYRMDQSMVTDYPQVDIPELGFDHPYSDSCIAKASHDKYPMAG